MANLSFDVTAHSIDCQLKKLIKKIKMFVLLSALAASDNNKMMLSAKIINGVHVLVPTSRIKLVEDAIRGKFISAEGNKESLSRLYDVFKYAVETEQSIQPAANNASFDFGVDYNQQTGWSFGTKFSIKWAKAQTDNAIRDPFLLDSPIRRRPTPIPTFPISNANGNKGRTSFDDFKDIGKTVYYPTPMPMFQKAKVNANGKKIRTPFEDLKDQGKTIYAPTPMPMFPLKNSKKERTTPFGGDIIKRPGTTVFRPEEPEFVKEERNDGYGSFSGGYSQGSGWGVEGGVGYSWGKGSVQAGGSWSQKGGAQGSVSIKINFALTPVEGESTTEGEDVRELFVTEVITPDYILYLPTYTEGKFDNLVEQIFEEEAEISTD